MPKRLNFEYIIRTMNYIGKKGVRREWEERRTNTWAEPQCSTCWLYLWTCFQFPALLKSSTANATPRPSKYTLPCPVDGMSFKYSYKVKVFCNIDATDMVSACPSSPGCFPEPVLWGRKFSASISYMNFTLERPQNHSNSETFSFGIGKGYSKHSESQSNSLLDT